MNESCKPPAASFIESRYLLMPNQANPHGTAFGGAIVAWVDMVGAMSAQKHCGSQVVTAHIDSISFREPICVGDHVVLKGQVDYVGKTSMEVGVQVVREDPYTGAELLATTANLTFVALDQEKKPTVVPKISPETESDKRRYENARLRVTARKELFAKMR